MGERLGERIAGTLRRRGMTQSWLAARLGLTAGAMCRYISGEREPRPEVLAGIAVALGVTSDALLGIEPKGYDHARTRSLLARNAPRMSGREKRELVNAILGGD